MRGEGGGCEDKRIKSVVVRCSRKDVPTRKERVERVQRVFPSSLFTSSTTSYFTFRFLILSSSFCCPLHSAPKPKQIVLLPPHLPHPNIHRLGCLGA